MSEAFKSMPDIATIQPERLIKYRISEDRFAAEVLLPGLWYTDFDKKIGGKPTLFSIFKIVESVRWTGMLHGFFFNPELISGGNRLIFVAAINFSFSKEAHRVRDDIWGYKRPFRFVSYLSDVGKTSFTVTEDMFDQTTGIKIMAGVIKVVYIDGQLRKPAVLPDWFVTNVQQYLQNKVNHSLVKANIVGIPEGAFRYEVYALQSDCDTNFHVNQATFLKWCTDAGAIAALNGKYNSFTDDIGLYALENINVQYNGEVLRNEKVDIYTWEDKFESRTLHFSMKKDGDLMFSAKLKYYNTRPVTGLPRNASTPKL